MVSYLSEKAKGKRRATDSPDSSEIERSKRLREGDISTEIIDNESVLGYESDESLPSILSDGDFDDNLFEKPDVEAPNETIPPNASSFNIWPALIRKPHIIIHVCKWMHPKTMLALYCVDKNFHKVMSRTYMSYMKTSAMIHAPYGAICFPFQCFRRLCIEDPTGRPLERDMSGPAYRHVPGFRWLQMVTFRHTIAENILRSLHILGHDLPNYAIVAVQKVWFTMSFGSNGARIALLHNDSYWKNIDLFVATQFFIKLDMRFTDPTHGQGEVALRQLFLAQPSLVPLGKLLAGRMNIMKILQYWVLYDYNPSARVRNMKCMGVPRQLIGSMAREAWGLGHRRGLRIDEGVMQEGFRRRLIVSTWFLDMICYGYQSPSDNTPIAGIAGKPRRWAKIRAELPDDAGDEEFERQMLKNEEETPGILEAFRGLRLHHEDF